MSHPFMKLLALTAFACCQGVAMAADESAIVRLHFTDRPPYSVPTNDGNAKGLYADPSSAAFKKAGVPFKWEQTPYNRQQTLLKENKNPGQDMHCAIGYFRTPEREVYAKFTEAVYRSKPMVAIANLQLKEVPTFEQMLKQYTIVVKESYSYGADVDAMIKQLKPKQVVTPGQPSQVYQMIVGGRADYMIASQEEVDYYVQTGVVDATKVKILVFPDMPRGLYRHIICSKSVSDDIINRLNKVIGSNLK